MADESSDINESQKEGKPKDRLRLVIASVFACVGFINGVKYTLHMCDAGHPYLELFGVSIVTFLLIMFVRRYRYSIPIAMALLIAQYCLRNPYVEWIHR